MDELSPARAASDLTGRGVPIRTLAVTIVASVVSLFALRIGAVLIAPLLVSVLLAYALEPAVALVTRCRLSRGCAIVAVTAALLAAVGIVGWITEARVVGFIATLPATARDLHRVIDEARRPRVSARPGPVDRLERAAADVEATLETAAVRRVPGVARVVAVAAPFNVRAYLAGALPTLAATAVHFTAIGLLTILLLFTGETLKRKLIAIAGPGAQKRVTHDVIKAIDRQIERYLVARLLISAIVGGATWFGLWALGLRDSLVLGLIAGVLNVMPFIGPAVAVALIALAAFVQFHTIEMTAWATIVSGAIAALEGNLISPWLTGRAGELNTVAVFVSVLFWGWMWDVWGLVLAIPITVAIKAAADHIEPLQPLGELLGR
jgi:predicted PurR-regulated permease PerM